MTAASISAARLGQQAVRAEEVEQRHVAHAEAEAGDPLGGVEPDEVVVAAAAEQRTPVVRVGVEHLEHRGGVVVEAAHDQRVERDELAGRRVQHLDELRLLLDLGGDLVEHRAPAAEHLAEPVELLAGQPDRLGVGGELVRRVLLPPVDDAGHVAHRLGRDADDAGEHRVEQQAVVDAQHPHVRRGPDRGHQVVDELEELDLAGGAVGAEHVDVDLPVLPHPAALRALVAVAVRVAVPAHGELQPARVAGDHASDRRRHLRPQCEAPVAAVGERVQLLLDDLPARLGLVDLDGLEDRAVVALVAVPLDHVVEMLEDLRAHRHLGRQEVAGTTVRGGRQELGHGVQPIDARFPRPRPDPGSPAPIGPAPGVSGRTSSRGRADASRPSRRAPRGPRARAARGPPRRGPGRA